MRYDGTLGTLQARLGGAGGNKITLRDHRSGASEEIGGGGRRQRPWRRRLRHRGRFLRAARGESESDLPTAADSLESHLLASPPRKRA